MSKSKHSKVQPLQTSSPDQQLTYFKNRARQKLHLLKSKIMQYQENHYSVHDRRNLSLHEITQRYVDAITKKSRNDNLSNRQNPQYFRQIHSDKDIDDPSAQIDIEQLTNEQKIYIDNPVLHFDSFSDEGKKWRVSWNCEINFMDVDLEEILGMLMMFESGYFPFACGKKQTKSKVYVQHLDRVKKRPSRKIETFKSPIAGGYWMVFSWVIERLDMQNYVMCVCLNLISKEVNTNKVDYAIDTMFEQTRFAISPGETSYSLCKQNQQKSIHYFKFGDNIQHFLSNDYTVKKILPTKLQSEFKNNRLSSFTDPILATSSSHAFHQVQLSKDNTNYDCVRYIYKELSDKECFSYSLSPSQYDILEQKGNLIVIGRSGTGKTTCALLRMFFKQLNNADKNQKNVFLTASPVLIAEIAKKFNQLKEGIKQLHDYDYFNKSITTTNTISVVQKFIAKLDETNYKLSQVKRSHFLQSKYFPYFLTIRDYIENLDASMDKPFFSTKEENQNDNDERKQQRDIEYPDEIAWQMRIIRTRNLQCNERKQAEQQWAEIDYFHFQSKIYTLPEFKHASKTLSPEMVWSEIFSTIKGSSRAHSFFQKFLNFETYCKQSKNQFLSLEQKKKVYELFLLYEKHKETTKQYDLLDVVNHIIFQLKSREQNQDIALTSLFIDEIQDLPPAFVFLTGKIVQESVFFCGDTAQTIAKGVNFSFSAVREQFQPRYYENNLKLQKPNIKHLNVNFRSQNQIIQLSNSLIRCLQIMFPQSIDRMPMQISPNSGMKPLIIMPHEIRRIVEQFQHSPSSNSYNQKSILFGADKAIIVRKQSDKALIPEELSKMTCLTYQECKGLEYNVVILYNFFSSCSDTQWAFLKNIELQTNSKGQRLLSFNKNKLGSNIRMYYDLCSELKILYTVVTRPRSALIICDQKVPDQLMRIWSFLDVVRESESSRQQGRYTSTFKQKYSVREQTKKINRQKEEKTRQFSKVDDDKFYKAWVQEGFKMFFQQKLYSQAQKCFENIKLRQLANISHAFSLANSACYNAKNQVESIKIYQQAAKLFQEQERPFEAGKCYYQAKSYFEALRNFRTLNIKKYVAACLWKMGHFFEAEKIFFQQQKFQKGLLVMVQSQYWAWFFSRLYSYSVYLVQCKTISITSGIKQGAQSLISAFSLYLIERNMLKRDSDFYQILEQTLFNCKNYGATESIKIRYFTSMHQKFVKLQRQNSLEGSVQNLGSSSKSGVIWTELFNGMILKREDSVLIALLLMISYIEQKYAQYYKLNQYRKYKNVSIKQQNQNSKILQKPQDQQPKLLNKYLTISLKSILNFLETFRQFEFIVYLTNVLKQHDIQLLVILENLLQLNQSVNNQQLEREDMKKRVNLHHRMLKHVDDKDTANKLKIFLMLFGAIKGVDPSLKNQIRVMKWYMGCSDHLFDKIISFRLDHCANYHNIYSFTSQSESKLNQLNQIKPFSAHPYCVIFKLIDQSSTISYFQTNQKGNIYQNEYSRLTEQEQDEIKIKISQQVSDILKNLINKINSKKNLIKKKEEQKKKTFIETSNQQIEANKQQKRIAKQIQEYLWLPQECEYIDEQPNSLKKDYQQIEKQLIFHLKKIDSKKKEQVKPLEKKLNKLKQLQGQEKSCKQIQKQKTSSIMQKIQKIEVEYDKAFLQKEKLTQEINRKGQYNKKTNQTQEISFGKKISNWFADITTESSQNKLKRANSELQKIKISKLTAKKQFDKVLAQINTIKMKILKDLSDLDNESYQNFVSNGNDKLDLMNLIQGIFQEIRKSINEKIQKTCQQYDNQARQVEKQYKKVIQNIKNYVYYRQTVPEMCIQKRKSLINMIEAMNQELLKMQTKKQQDQFKIKARVKDQFKKKFYKKHVRKERRKYLKEKILNVKDSNVKAAIDNQLLQVIEVISRLEIETNQPITIYVSQRVKTSKLLEYILKQKEQSLAKLWILLYFLLHNEEIPLLEKSIAVWAHKFFRHQLKNFGDKILKADESDIIMRNVLAIFGVNVIDAAEGNEFMFLDGFSIVEKKHIISSELRKLFFHNISDTHIFCQTKETVIVFQTYILNRIQKSDILRRIFNVNFTIAKKVDQLNYRDEGQLIQNEMKMMKSLREWHASRKINKYCDLNMEEILLIKEKLSDIKKVLFSQLIILQESLQVNNEIRSQKMLSILARINIVSSFTNPLIQLDQILIRYTQQKRREVDLLQLNENMKQYGSNGSQIYTIEDTRKNFINSMKQKQSKYNQVLQQNIVRPNYWNMGMPASKADKQQMINTVEKTRQIIEQKIIKTVVFREQEQESESEQEYDYSQALQYQYDSQDSQHNYQNKTYYDMAKKKWVAF